MPTVRPLLAAAFGIHFLLALTTARAESLPWRIPADFERHPALLLGAAQMLFHHPDTLAEIAAALEGRAEVYGLVSTPAQARALRDLLHAHELPIDAVKPVVVPVQSMWLRDYGPVFVEGDDGAIGIVDARYGGSAQNPDDELVPSALADAWEAPVVDSDLWLEGGQILSNGQGLLLVSTALFWRNVAHEQIGADEAVERLRATLPFDQALNVQPLHGEPTGHLDMFLAFLDVDLLVVARIDPAIDPINAERLDRTARRLAGTPTAAGPLRVERIDMPAATDGIWRSYTNCAMVGDVVLVPSYPEAGASFDRAARAFYEQWASEHEIVLIEATTLAARRGALHCVSVPVPASAWRLIGSVPVGG